MLTKIEMETLEAIKSFCRREPSRQYVKTMDFDLNRKTYEDIDNAINEFAKTVRISQVTSQTYSTPSGTYITYTILYKK